MIDAPMLDDQPVPPQPLWQERFAAALDGAIRHHSNGPSNDSPAVMLALMEVRDALREALVTSSGWRS